MNRLIKITCKIFKILTLCILSFASNANGQTYIMLPPDGIGDLGQSTSQTAPTPYRSDQDHNRFQTIYTRDNLIAGGAPSTTGCEILSIGFNISQVINAAFYNAESGLVNYTIKMKNIPVSVTAVGNAFQPIDDAAIVKVPFNLNYTVINSTGFHDFVLDAPFVWDGVGNILIDICYGINNGVASGTTTRGQVRLHSWNNFTISNTTRREFASNSINICGSTGNNVQQASHKPVARMGFIPEITEPTCNFSITPNAPSICSGQSIQLTAIGEATNYSWSPTVGLSAAFGPSVSASPSTTTTYTVSGTNGSCNTTQTVTIIVNQPSSLEITPNPSNATNLCNGPISLTIPTDFTNAVWSNGINNINSILVNSPGSYSVTAFNAQGCASTSQAIIIDAGNAPAVQINPTQNLFLCTGSITLSASPGLNNYIWSHGVNGESVVIDQAGEYFVTAQNNEGCIGQSLTVTVNPAYTPEVIISAPTTTSCIGNLITISNNQNFTNYIWSNGNTNSAIDVSQSGDYSLSATDTNGCVGVSQSISILFENPPSAGFTYNQTNGYTVNFENTSTNANSFLWIFHDNSTSTLSNPVFTYFFDATYPVTLISQNDCGSDTISSNVIVIKPASISHLNAQKWKIFPNPFTDHISIESGQLTNEKMTVTLSNTLGQIVYQINYPETSKDILMINTSQLSKGIYFVQLKTHNVQTTHKIIKQ